MSCPARRSRTRRATWRSHRRALPPFSLFQKPVELPYCTTADLGVDDCAVVIESDQGRRWLVLAASGLWGEHRDQPPQGSWPVDIPSQPEGPSHWPARARPESLGRCLAASGRARLAQASAAREPLAGSGRHPYPNAKSSGDTGPHPLGPLPRGPGPVRRGAEAVAAGAGPGASRKTFASRSHAASVRLPIEAASERRSAGHWQCPSPQRADAPCDAQPRTARRVTGNYFPVTNGVRKCARHGRVSSPSFKQRR